MSRVLVAGVYLAASENLADAAIAELSKSRRHQIEQRWIAIDESGSGRCDLPGTVAVVAERTPKFALLGDIVSDAGAFDYLVVCDDDVGLPAGFLDDFIALAERFEFALAQPARTLSSYVDHAITRQAPGLLARATRFVEIGPVFAANAAAMRLILPFDARTPMGWGLDFVWPLLIEREGLRMGIVDATPVDHSFRPPVANYVHAEADAQQKALLAKVDHLDKHDAFTVTDAYA